MLDIIPLDRLSQLHWDSCHKPMETGTTQYGSDLLCVLATYKDGSAVAVAFTVAMLDGDVRDGTACAAVIRDDAARFNGDRALRKRLADLEARLPAWPAAPR